MNKEFLSPEFIRNNALKMAYEIHTRDGFVPDIIYTSLRGGAYLANVFSEYFKIIKHDKERPVLYAAVVARSYSDIRSQTQVMIDGWTYDPKHLRPGDKVLLVDDIFDTGQTVNYLADVIMANGIDRKDLKIAVHDYKVAKYKGELLPFQPDYYSRKHVLETPEDDVWIHYLNHEFVGLTNEEIDQNYDDVEVKKILKKTHR
ncbi:MAG: phosphoribosyltransferase [Spirochaetia bacterium]|nr:phosphoribosyltransferase [Spirochaetia bacterium]MCF7946354.1 phosphoribosyltransferase [Spirochaetia bacterium]